MNTWSALAADDLRKCSHNNKDGILSIRKTTQDRTVGDPLHDCPWRCRRPPNPETDEVAEPVFYAGVRDQLECLRSQVRQETVCQPQLLRSPETAHSTF